MAKPKATTTINMTTSNTEPTITSNGGGSVANVDVAENYTAVTSVTAGDVDTDALIDGLVSAIDDW